MQNEEQEIDLVEYVKILIKYKYLIVSVLIISLIIGAIIYFKASEKYEVAIIVAIKDAPMTAKEISENIKAGDYSDVIKSVNLDSGKLVLSVGELTENLLKISAKTENNNSAAAMAVLNAIYDKLDMQNKKYIAERKEILNSQQTKKQKVEKEGREINNKKVALKIKLLNIEINNYKDRISILEEETKKPDVKLIELVNEYEQAKKEYDNCIIKKEQNIYPKNRADIGLAVYYKQIVADKLKDVNNLKEQIDLQKKNVIERANEIKQCKRNIENKQIEIEMAKLEMMPIEDIEKIDSAEGLADIKLRQEPATSKIKISKKPILMVSILVGFVVSLFLIISIEFLKRILLKEKKIY